MKTNKTTSDSSYRKCTRCIMSTRDDKHLIFDSTGLCNLCFGFDKEWERIPKNTEESELILSPTIEKLKRYGKGKKYDCLIGVSGGVDSTYLALLLKKYGLRPLAVHFDNGWNSELAVKNIEKIVSTLDIDLYTYVINWEEFKRLQLAYLHASVVDIEVLTDHAIYGTMYKLANKFDIKYIVSGVNIATEAGIPETWNYNKHDSVNIKSIFREFGGGVIDSYPFVDKKVRRMIKNSGIEIIQLLNMIVFDIKKAKSEIENELGWRSYQGKHFESIFTRFYQGYILPKKFGIDKRRVHLSNLICSSQLTKEEAEKEMESDIYSEDQIAEDMEFVLKKLELSKQEFDEIMALPVRRHQEFDMESSFFSRNPLFRPLKPLWKRLKSNAS